MTRENGDRPSLSKNDEATGFAVQGDFDAAAKLYSEALESEPALLAPRLNLALLSARGAIGRRDYPSNAQKPRRVAVLSFLFNWPSRGGGIHHTVEFTTALKN